MRQPAQWPPRRFKQRAAVHQYVICAGGHLKWIIRMQTLLLTSPLTGTME